MRTIAVGDVDVVVADDEAAERVRSYLDGAGQALARQPELLTRIDELSDYERHLERAAFEMVTAASRLLLLVHPPDAATAALRRAIPSARRASPRAWVNARNFCFISAFATARTDRR